MLEDKTINHTKLVRLFKTLSAKEVRLLGDWVRSPFFNKHEKVVRLYEFLKKQHPKFRKPIPKSVLVAILDFSSVSFVEGKIWPIADKNLRGNMHKLTVCILDFLVWQKQQEDHEHTQALLNEELNARNI